MNYPVVLAALLGAATAASAQLVTYPSLNVNFTIPGSTASSLSTGDVAISLAPDHRYIDPDSGTPAASAARYYGGTIAFAPSSNEWGSQATLRIQSAGDDVVFTAGGGENFWRVFGSSSSATTTLPRGSTFDFVIKLEDTAWNTTAIKVFLGANANTLAEGAADYTVNINNLNAASPLTSLGLTLTHENWDSAAASLTTSNMFSATEWTPVSAVPEPSAYALLAGVAALGFALRRRRS